MGDVEHQQANGGFGLLGTRRKAVARKKKFREIWSNQTELGKKFDISAIEVGKILIQYGLKDPNTKEATKKALDDGYAKSAPLKAGTPYYMWNIEKVEGVLSQKHQTLNQVDYWANQVKIILQEADLLSEKGNKLADYMYDSAYEEVPKDIVADVRHKVEASNCQN
jgi:hypothetical protein